jgi:hypothetical protein
MKEYQGNEGMMKKSTLAKEDSQRAASGRSRYRTLSLVELIRKIVETGDLDALHEFHNNRPIFRYNNGPPLLLAEYLMELGRSLLRKGSAYSITQEKVDKAYDMTIEKFTNILISEFNKKEKGERSDH